MSNICNVNHYAFPRAKNVMVSGDIHGEFDELVDRLCDKYKMTDTLLIVAGDCGFGLRDKSFYDDFVARTRARMDDANNWLVFVRGNQDNPSYFDGKSFCYERFIAVPDYSVVEACHHSILCVGGAISIDRTFLKRAMRQRAMQLGDADRIQQDKFARSLYWPNENPIFDEGKIEEISERYAIDTVVTHTAPSFCEFFQKEGLSCSCYSDESIKEDVEQERSMMDLIHQALLDRHHPLKNWFYGHFHQSMNQNIGGRRYTMLGVMDFQMIYD